MLRKLWASVSKSLPSEVAAKDHPLAVGLAAVVDGVARAVDDRLAVLVVNGVALVADVPVELAIGPEDERVGRVVVLRLADLREQDVFLVGLAVAVVVGEDKHVGRHRDDHLVAEHADAERTIDVSALVENRLLVGTAVVIGVFEDQDPIALRAVGRCGRDSSTTSQTQTRPR